MKTSKRTLVTAISISIAIAIAICSAILSCASTDKSASAGVSSNCQNEMCTALHKSLSSKNGFPNLYSSNFYSDSDWENAEEFVNNCECWIESIYSDFSLKYLDRQRKYYNIKHLVDNLQKPLKERQAKKESVNAINTLIENNNEEISFVLDKCNEYRSKYGEIHKTCGHIQDSIKNIQKLTQDSIQNSMNFTQDSMTYQQAKPEIMALLKANKLEECFGKCKQLGSQFKSDKFKNNEEYANLCGEQLNAKIKKLPLKQINSVGLAKIYYQGTDYREIYGRVIQNDGKMVLVSAQQPYGQTIMVQISGHLIGNCSLIPINSDYHFRGFAKPLGNKTYTSLMGLQTVGNYQLLWCESFAEKNFGE